MDKIPTKSQTFQPNSLQANHQLPFADYDYEWSLCRREKGRNELLKAAYLYSYMASI